MARMTIQLHRGDPKAIEEIAQIIEEFAGLIGIEAQTAALVESISVDFIREEPGIISGVTNYDVEGFRKNLQNLVPVH